MGMDKAIEEVKYRMSRYSVTPNMLIIPPQLSLYMALAPEAKLTYQLAGPAGQAAFNSGVQGFEAQSFRGLGVFTSTPYEVSDDQDSVQMLQRSTQIGEFYRMSPPAVWDSSRRLPSSYMDIMIYDEESDRHVHIPFEQAIWATCYGHAQGPTGDLFQFSAMPEDVKAKVNKSSADMPIFGGAQGELAGAFQGGRADGSAGLGTWLKETTRDYNDVNDIVEVVNKLIEAVRAGVWVPVEIVITRPFIEHLMLSAIVTVSGRDTGATLFGPAGKSLHHTRPLSLFTLLHVHTHLLRASTLPLRSGLTCLCPLLPRLQTCRSPPTPL
jgi:hypothetical protein